MLSIKALAAHGAFSLGWKRCTRYLKPVSSHDKYHENYMSQRALCQVLWQKLQGEVSRDRAHNTLMAKMAHPENAWGIFCWYREKGEGEQMGVYSIGTEKYEADIGWLMSKRLEKLGCGIVIHGDKSSVSAELSGAVQMEEWCAAVAELLLMR